MESKVVKGSCLCGEVSYEITPPFKSFRYCHCPRCRKHTGSAHASNLFVAPDHYRWVKGEDVVSQFNLPDARSFARCFCTKCGSPVPHHSRRGNYVVVPAGSLDDDPHILPECSIFWDFRAPWFKDFDDIPKFAEYPPDKE